MAILTSNIPWPHTQAAVPSTLNINEWQIPSGNAGPAGINVDSTGRVWFTENQTGKLGMLDPAANKIYEWNLPGQLPRSSVNSRNILTSPTLTDGSANFRAYFAEYGYDKIAYLDTTAPTPTVTTTVTSTTTIITSTTTTNTANYLTEWQLPTGSKPVSIFIDDQENIWFTESGRDAIGELIGGASSNPTGTQQNFIEWTLPGGNPSAGTCGALCVWGLFVQPSGSDHYVWFTERTGGNADAGLVGRLQLSNNLLTTWDLSTLGVYQPRDIAVDSAGNAYFSNYLGNRISVLDNSGTYKEYEIATAAEPVAVTTDPTRNLLWFLEYTGNNIAYLNSSAPGNTRTPSNSQCVIPSTVTMTTAITTSRITYTTTSNLNPNVTPCSGGAYEAGAVSMTTATTSLAAPNVVNINPSTHPLGSAQALPNGISEYSLPSANSRPYGVTLDSSDNLWLTESDYSANRIAEVPFAADFNIQLTSPAQVAVPQGGEYAFLINVNAVSGSQSQVSLSVNAPSGLQANFIPSIGTPPFQSVLTITTTVSTPPSTYSMTITATSSSATRSLNIALTVLSISAVSSTVSSISSQSSVTGTISTVILTTTIYSIGQSGGTPTSTYVQVWSNSTISALQFDSSRRLLNFTATGPSGTIGQTKVVIAETLLDGSPTVIIDDGRTPLLSLRVTSNSTDYTIDFTYPHSTHAITVGGQNSIPEFTTSLPALAIPLLFITLGVRIRRKARVSKTTREIKHPT
jgi:streptogramin lyase